MNKIFLSILVLTLCGCVDLGRIGMHPELKTTYFNVNKHEVESCLEYSAFKQKLSLTVDDPLPGGTDRYNLTDAGYNDVAWVDISNFGDKQTSVSFYYAPHAPDVHKAILSMISVCQSNLY
ncbi:hypothetical protein [Citrobacter koseri]|uniref:hypothetical protein n=1 Tax=Citrobacter koseri TaxID=545 RepID=UPI0040399505